MPIFEYRCQECNYQFETIVSGSNTRVECPGCRSTRAEKLFSTFAVSGSIKSAALETGPCGTCGAPRRGMCGE
ncbi:MAG: zinc ribbon domain-containing protein [Acidobacteria bacterium]|nr:zinc ribbon domain-containing protein [Acidobacteriota bacterium]